MTVIHWAKTGYRMESRAMFHPVAIKRQTEKSIMFLLSNGKTVSINRSNIISVEMEENENEEQ